MHVSLSFCHSRHAPGIQTSSGFLRNRLKSLFRSEISEMRASMMKDEEAYTEYTATNLESCVAAFLKLQPNTDFLDGFLEDLDSCFHGNDTQGHYSPNSLSPVCTHAGCMVEFNHHERTWGCPCHGSHFNTKGDVTSGPAKRPLDKKE